MKLSDLDIEFKSEKYGVFCKDRIVQINNETKTMIISLPNCSEIAVLSLEDIEVFINPSRLSNSKENIIREVKVTGMTKSSKFTGEREEVQKLQLEAYRLLSELKYANLYDYDTLFSLIIKIQPYTTDERISMPPELIISKLKTHGYVNGENCGPSFDENNEENSARYIVGQCLATLEDIGKIPSFITDFIDTWVKKFKNTSSCKP